MPEPITPGQGISLNHALFRQALARRVDSIKRLCKEYGVPRLATHVTLILRDPANDQMSFVLSDDTSLDEAYRVARLLEEEDPHA